MSVPPLFSVLPYAQATPAQRQQVLHSARQVLAAAYPHLSGAQWATALEQVQPGLWGQAGQQVLLAHEGLAALVQYLAAPDRPAAAAFSPKPADPATGSSPPEPPAAAGRPAGTASPALASLKQTYAIPVDLREQLARLSYWRRVPVNQLVVHALRRFLADYPDEAARPIPPPPALP